MTCTRPECQTTAGCAYRGPKGEYCYYAGNFERHGYVNPPPALSEERVRQIVREELIKYRVLVSSDD